MQFGVEFCVTRAYAGPLVYIFAELTSLNNLLLHNVQLILPEQAVGTSPVRCNRKYFKWIKFGLSELKHSSLSV